MRLKFKKANLKKIFFLGFAAFFCAVPCAVADAGPRGTNVTIESSERDLFGPNPKEETEEGIIFYKEGSTTIGAAGDGAGLRNSF